MGLFHNKRRSFALTTGTGSSAKRASVKIRMAILCSAFIALYMIVIVGLYQFGRTSSERHYSKRKEKKHKAASGHLAPKDSSNVPFHFPQTSLRRTGYNAMNRFGTNTGAGPHCPSYSTINDLKSSELYPEAGHRHMVTPPEDGRLTLVCCSTTKGPMSIAVHHKWAPLGARRFLDMVETGYFRSIPMMRCIEDWLCQFGISDSAKNNNEDNVQFQETILDDPQWLPTGKENRENKNGVKRFAKGYLAYAGNGRNSRDKQLILALESDGHLAGLNPWEVPWGELVGEHSFETMSKFYTGYGEEYPTQSSLEDGGMTEEKREKWPLLDYIHECNIFDERMT